MRACWPVAILLLVLALALPACTGDGRRSTPPAARLVAIAASDGVGAGAANPQVDGWVAQLHALMPSGTRLANLSVPSLRMRQAVEQMLPIAVDLQPAVVAIWLAVNDFSGGVPLQQYQADLDLLLATLAERTSARVYVANLPDPALISTLRSGGGAEVRELVRQWNAAIAVSARTNGAILVDLFEGWEELRAHPEYISSDGLHPSTAGHRRLAALFWEAIGGL